MFVNSIQSARSAEHKISELGFKVSSLHGDIPPLLRKKYLDDFKQKKTEILVATDLGSRGLDFPFVSHVFNLDFPRTISDYLHRAGRAGRAGREGYVKSFYRNYDTPLIKQMQQSFQESTPLKIASSAFSLRKTQEPKSRTWVQAVSDPDKRQSLTDPYAQDDQSLIINRHSTKTIENAEHQDKSNKRVLRYKSGVQQHKLKKSSPVKEMREKKKIKRNFDRFQQEQSRIFKPIPQNR